MGTLPPHPAADTRSHLERLLNRHRWHVGEFSRITTIPERVLYGDAPANVVQMQTLVRWLGREAHDGVTCEIPSCGWCREDDEQDEARAEDNPGDAEARRWAGVR